MENYDYDDEIFEEEVAEILLDEFGPQEYDLVDDDVQHSIWGDWDG